MTRWVASVNPAAGRRGVALACARDLLARGLVARVETSAQRGDIAARVRAADDAAGIVAVGGDGTILEVLAGLDRGRQALAVMPVGHGNCLARDLGLASVAAARAALQAGTERTLDLMQVDVDSATGCGRVLAASTLAAGYVADVVALGRGRLPGLGRWAYAVASTLARPRALEAELMLDGRDAPLAGRTGVVINNTRHLANFRAFAAARIDDGVLDVMELAGGRAHQLAHNACVLLGSRRFGAARNSQARSVRVDLPEPGLLMIDGELVAQARSMVVECLPAALRCAAAP